MTRFSFGTRIARRGGGVISRTVLIALLVHTGASGVLAQPDESPQDVDSPGLVIEGLAGWDGAVDLSKPVPLSFLIRNDSDHIIEGHLRLSDPMRGREVSLGEIVVAPGTARRVTSIEAMTDWFECFATLSNGTQILWRRELPLQTGSEFIENVNFALFIDDGGRRLELPGTVLPSSALATTPGPIAGKDGRPVQCLTVKSWQVPNHPGPLIAAQAMIFPEGAAEDQLNQVQWQAVANWMSEGGMVFVHKESDEIIDRLAGLAPVDAGRTAQAGAFIIRRVGLGAIQEYGTPLLPSSGHEIRKQIGETIAKLPRNHISTFLQWAHWYPSHGGRADLNRAGVIGFFGLYTLFSGVVALLLFRLSQRRMGAYAVSVVVGASILSGLLGGYLRYSRGDLHWITVTQAGAGGIVQVGRIEVQSAGGRNTDVAVNGDHADLQFLGGEQRYYPWYQSPTGYPPFTWQPNLATHVDDTYQVNVTMTPWGRRRLQATAFQRSVQPLDFRLDFQPRDLTGGNEGAATEAANMPSGVFRLKLVNHLSYQFEQCWLVIGVTATISDQAAATPQPVYGPSYGPGGPPSTPVDGLIDVYQQRSLLPLSAGATREDSFEAEFKVLENRWEQMIQVPDGTLSPPRIARLGSASAWIIALIRESPILMIDEQRTDFVPQDHLHIFVQEIRPEDMPDAANFFDADTVPESPRPVDGTRVDTPDGSRGAK